MIPLLFRPCLTAETSAGTCAIPLRCNRRNLSQPYRFRLFVLTVRCASRKPCSICRSSSPLSLQNRNGFGGVLCKFAHADVLSSSLCFVFMHWFMLTHLHQFVNRKKPAVRGFFIFSPFGGPFIHRNNYLWFALITDIAASSATTVRSL